MKEQLCVDMLHILGHTWYRIVYQSGEQIGWFTILLHFERNEECYLLEALLLPQSDLQKYQQRMKELQTHSEQQSKVLKVKTEEVYTP